MHHIQLQPSFPVSRIPDGIVIRRVTDAASASTWLPGQITLSELRWSRAGARVSAGMRGAARPGWAAYSSTTQRIRGGPPLLLACTAINAAQAD